MTESEAMIDEGGPVFPPARGRCQRCGKGADDLWIVRLDGKIALLCPACFADRRIQGRDIRIMKEGS